MRWRSALPRGARPRLDAAHQLALRAALLGPADARRAFAAWLEQTDLSADFDHGTLRILPLLYANLRRAEVSHPFMGRLKGTFRRAWYTNSALVTHLGQLVAQLDGAGVPAMVGGDVPMALLHYPQHAQRPITNVGILVPPEYVRPAISLLGQHGCRPHARPSDDYLLFHHTLRLSCPQTRGIDLCWYPTDEMRDVASQRMLWESAVSVSVGATAARCPSPAVLLIQAVMAGVRLRPPFAIQWIPDAIVTIRAVRKSDTWDDLVEFVIRNRLTQRTLLGLRFVQEQFGADVPDIVFRRLSHSRISLIERVEIAHLRSTPYPGVPSAFGRCRLALIEYHQITRRWQPMSFVVGLAHYLRFRQRRSGRAGIPRALGRRLVTLIRSAVSWRTRQQCVKMEVV